MKNNSLKLALMFFLSATIPVASQYFLSHGANENNFLFLTLWVLINYLFIGTIEDFLLSYSKIFKLKNLIFNKITLIINLIVYFSFLIYLNLYFLQQLYIKDNYLINTLANPLVALLIFITFLINLNCGILPHKKEQSNSRIISIKTENSFREGKERFGVLVGGFERGIVLGTDIFYYADMNSIYYDKNKALMVKGKDENGNYIILIEAPKSKDAAISILKKAQLVEKLNGINVNI